ncbi:MAG TPA: outer membrane beta-barrel protein [Balneolaceae bacterium]|nr:outer membrane beta-barrel protein [Balneolaceae bacterium]
MKSKIFILIIVIIATAVNLKAQDQGGRFSFEFSTGASFATQELSGTNLNTGLGFEGIFHYRIYKHTGAYAGWGWKKFSSGESFAGNNMDFEETGYLFGLQFKHPLGFSNLSYYLRAGGLYNHIEVENTNGDIIDDTGHGLGWQLAGGVELPIGGKWNLTGGLKFNSLSRELDTEEISRNLDLNSLSLQAGVVRNF